MPYMLELAAIISLAVEDYADFGIIAAMLICNGVLGFEEQRKAAESLVIHDAFNPSYITIVIQFI